MNEEIPENGSNLHSAIELEELEKWFSSFGNTDTAYLKNHYSRFCRTYQFVAPELQTGSSILDIGSHWLHQAFFYVHKGHLLTCADATGINSVTSIRKAAEILNINLVSYNRMDLGEGISELPTNSFDLVLCNEVIEHLAFNPINFWKQIYRVMKPGASLIITTPNSVYFRFLFEKLSDLVAHSQLGISLDSIFHSGTHGHHWKEFSIHELIRYFSLLSSDFQACKIWIESLGCTEEEERKTASTYTIEEGYNKLFDFQAIIKLLDKKGSKPFGSQIFVNFVLKEKKEGITISAPWQV
jgi:2-polyprenyl-3-methyl-5-hydroxy-6-metoxy-1,4-benzoquinol methylase